MRGDEAHAEFYECAHCESTYYATEDELTKAKWFTHPARNVYPQSPIKLVLCNECNDMYSKRRAAKGQE